MHHGARVECNLKVQVRPRIACEKERIFFLDIKQVDRSQGTLQPKLSECTTEMSRKSQLLSGRAVRQTAELTLGDNSLLRSHRSDTHSASRVVFTKRDGPACDLHVLSSEPVLDSWVAERPK